MARAPPPANSAGTLPSLPARFVNCNRNRDLDRLLANPIPIQTILRAILSRGHALQKRAHQFLGIIQQIASHTPGVLRAIARAYLAQSLRARVTGRDLRAQVPFALLRRAHIIEQHRQYIRLHRAPPHQFHRWNAYALLIDFAAKPHRPGISPAHIRMMRPRRNMKIGPSVGAGDSPARFYIHRRDQRDIGQMRAAAKRIVQHHNISWLHRARINRRPHRHRHRSQMHRHVVAHGNHFTRAIENRA